VIKVDYTIDILKHFNKVPEDNIKLNLTGTFTIPFRGSNEILRNPREQLFIPKEVMSAGEEIIKSKKFRPGWVANYKGMKIKNGVIYVDANIVNYGALPVIRDLTQIFPDSIMLPVLNQIAPLAVHALMISPNNGSMYLARRVNVDCSGQLSTYPAGTVAEGNDIRATLREEAV